MTSSLADLLVLKAAREGVVLTRQVHCFRGPTRPDSGSTRAMRALALRLQSYIVRRPNHDVRALCHAASPRLERAVAR
jgi:hypothetical protein